VSAPRLRWALLSLYRDRRDASLALTREAERSIRRRMATRWGLAATGVILIGVVAGIGWSAMISPSSNNASPADPTPVAYAIPAVAHVPLAGGPQYNNLWGDFGCGDPAPAPMPDAPQQRLSVSLERSGVDGLATASVTWAAPAVAPLARSEPVLGRGATEVVAVRDGIVVGMIITQNASLGWQQHGHTISYTGQVWLGDPDGFYCISLDEQTNTYRYSGVVLQPGTYQVFAITRVFATPESVALFQALTDLNFTAVDERMRPVTAGVEPGPGYCEQLQSQGVLVRSCLPGAVPTASLDPATKTVTMLYDASALSQEFDVTLVSEPLTMVIE
jgi:hypothetical protein